MTRSPGTNPRTSRPTCATSPAISCPMIRGITPSPILLARIFASVPQTPTFRTRTSASCGAIEGVGTSFSMNGPPNSSSTKARIGLLRVWLPRSEAELRLPVNVDQHRVGDVPDVDRLHERELRRERLHGQRVPLGPLEPYWDGVPPELLNVILGQPDDLDSLGLVTFPRPRCSPSGCMRTDPTNAGASGRSRGPAGASATHSILPC